jgi:diacylglycerol kinase (ATP)
MIAINTISMHDSGELKLLFVINPISGGKAKQDWETSIRDYFKEKKHTIQFYVLTGGNDRISIQHHMDSFHPDILVGVGGDGTIKLLADILKETPIPMGIIPAGSANGMAKELAIPLEVNAALDIITGGEVKKIDLIKINEEHICIHLADLGLNAMLVKYYEKSKSRGWTSYAKALLKVMIQKQKFHCDIVIDEGAIKRKAYMVVLANASKYGTGGVINPEGDVSDSLFEVVIVKKLNVFAVLNGLIRGKQFKPEKIEIFHTKNLEITTRRKVHWQVDGEYLGKTIHVKARIFAQLLNVMVPKE